MKLINRLKNNYVLVIVLCIAAALRFYHVDYQSVWLDEIHTLNEVNPDLSLAELYNSLLGSDPHPPLYFILVHYAFIIFGYSSFVLKMFSAIVGVAGVFSVYILAKEISDKKTGIYAAVLLCINYFHLFYSQEGRMYSLLFLMTTISFYFLVKFIKKPSFKSAFITGIFSALMIYCHFFGLFTLVSQYLVLLFFIIRPLNTSRKKMVYYAVIAGITTVVLYLPALALLKKTATITSIWIPMPGPDVYTQIAKDFFGQSEMVLFFVLLPVVAYFIILFKEKEVQKFQPDPDKDKLLFSFILLFGWISVSLLLPLIRTYTNLPMLINRYFITILPAIIIIIAIGLFHIKNTIVRYGILSLIILFSFTDIVIVKKYYSTVVKTQFREVSKYIMTNNHDQDLVVSSLGWYFSFFLVNKNTKTNIYESPLEAYVDEIIKDTTKKRSFWYVDAHSRPLNISKTLQEYLNNNFVVDYSTEKYDAWTNHYSLTAAPVKEEDISRFKPLTEKNGDDFKYYVDAFTVDSNMLAIKGFAFFSNQDATDSFIKLLLLRDGKAFLIKSGTMRRGDVAPYYKITYDLSNCGFTATLKTNKLPPGKYQLAILIKNNKTTKEGLVICENYFTK